MKIRNGFVSNSSSSSFTLTKEKLEALKELRDKINQFLEECSDETEVVLSTEDSRSERFLYQVFDSIIYDL